MSAATASVTELCTRMFKEGTARIVGMGNATEGRREYLERPERGVTIIMRDASPLSSQSSALSAGKNSSSSSISSSSSSNRGSGSCGIYGIVVKSVAPPTRG